MGVVNIIYYILMYYSKTIVFNNTLDL